MALRQTPSAGRRSFWHNKVMTKSRRIFARSGMPQAAAAEMHADPHEAVLVAHQVHVVVARSYRAQLAFRGCAQSVPPNGRPDTACTASSSRIDGDRGNGTSSPAKPTIACSPLSQPSSAPSPPTPRVGSATNRRPGPSTSIPARPAPACNRPRPQVVRPNDPRLSRRNRFIKIAQGCQPRPNRV